VNLIRTLLIASLIAASLAAVPSANAAAPADYVGIDDAGNMGLAADGQIQVLNERLAAQYAAGIRTQRQGFLWRSVEKRKGRYDFGVLDVYMEALAAAKMRVLPVLFDAPNFRAKKPYRAPTYYPPKRAADFGVFAAKLVKRYGPKGSFWKGRSAAQKRTSAIRSWQIWNEPNLKTYWGKKPNAKQYVALLKAAHKAIRKADKGADIVTAGVPDSSTRGSIPLKKWFPAIYKAGAKKWFDVLAINAHSKTTKLVREKLVATRKEMKKHGDAKAPMWVTEIAWADGGPKSPYTKTTKGQAAEITKALAMLGKERKKLRLRGFFYYQWRDAPPYRAGLDIWGLHSGLLNLDGSAKPALKAFSRAAKKL
jgi:polysaccharide biosynthesis protein PslG